MIKPIHRVACSPALVSCQKMMQCFALWLCEKDTKSVDITLANLKARMPSAIESDWLWDFLNREVERTQLLERAKQIAALIDVEKNNLRLWIQATSKLSLHFSPIPPDALPTQLPNDWKPKTDVWVNFKVLFVSFYERGFKDGLPYQSDGKPTDVKADRINYAKFVAEFRTAHKLDPDPDAREICVLCGGELTEQEVDHWVSKGNFPLLSVCADNLLPICGECNAGDKAKGQKPVHSVGNFSDWFHPYLRPAYGALALQYQLSKMTISCVATNAVDQPKVSKLNELLNLESRWTREFKAEHRKKQKEAAVRKLRGYGPQDIAGLLAWLTEYRDGLVESEPNYEVHKALASAMLEPTRVASWGSTLGLLS
jgi:hypothetical protein